MVVHKEVQPLLRHYICQLAKHQLDYYKKHRSFAYRILALRNLVKRFYRVEFTHCESEIEVDQYFRVTVYCYLPTEDGDKKQNKLSFCGEYDKDFGVHKFRWYVGPEYIPLSFDTSEEEQYALQIFNEIILLLLGVDIQAILGEIKLEVGE